MVSASVSYSRVAAEVINPGRRHRVSAAFRAESLEEATPATCGGRRFAAVHFAKRHGFSMIELVMVVVILGILAAMIVPGMGNEDDEQEESRRILARVSLQELRDVIFNRYMFDMAYTINPTTTGSVALPQPKRSGEETDVSMRVTTTQADGSTAGVIPQLHFLFVNPHSYSSTSSPPYVATNDYDHRTRIGWNGPYVVQRSTVYPNPDHARFPDDLSNTLTWSQYGFTTLYGQAGDYCLYDPWGSPYVIQLLTTTYGGLPKYSAYVVSAGPNRTLDVSSWVTAPDGSLNSGDDLALPIKVWK